jgi:hypothetical protein
VVPGYTSPTAQHVYDKMCNFHRGIVISHNCGKETACIRAGRLAAWLEGLTEEDEGWIRQTRNYYANHRGEPWIGARISLDLAISGVREMV